jgi:hypothetical protein
MAAKGGWNMIHIPLSALFLICGTAYLAGIVAALVLLITAARR